LCRESLAGPAEAGDDLIEYQQDAVLVAEAAQSLQVALWRQQHAGRTRYRLDDDRSDVGCVVQLHQAFQVVGQFGAVFR